MKCYINKESGEYRSILDWDDLYDGEEFWQSELEKIESEWSDYIVLEKMSSHRSFSVMEDFTTSIEDKEVRDKLINVLNRNKPFRNFRNEVDYREDVRQRWFAFKQQAYENYVRQELLGEFLFD